MTSNTATVREHARYGAATQQEFDGPLPQPFPREIGPRAMEYLAEVVDSGLTCDMVGRFEQAFACLLYTSPSPRDGLLSRMPSSA